MLAMPCLARQGKHAFLQIALTRPCSERLHDSQPCDKSNTSAQAKDLRAIPPMFGGTF